MNDFSKYSELLKQFVSFKSVASAGSDKAELEGCAKWLLDLFAKNGATSATLLRSGTNPPAVFASYEIDKTFPTWLIYGHYDVQPAALSDGWAHEPFDLVETEKLFSGRGAVDNKGQILIHILNIIELFNTKELKSNIKFLIEGQEEVGSKALPEIMRQNQALLKCNQILISDGNIIGDFPVIEAGLRGVANVSLKLTTANTSVHSGAYGNTVPNAAFELARILGGIISQDNQVLVKGFSGTDPTSILDELPVSIQERITQTGHKTYFVPEGSTWHHETGSKASLIITGVKSGHAEQGFANIVPHTAEAKFNLRFGLGQDPEQLIAFFREHIASLVPDYVSYELESYGGIPAVKLNTESKEAQRAGELLQKIYGHAPVKLFVGGSLPIIAAFKEILGIEPLSVPLANEDCNMHGAGENFSKEKLAQAFRFSRSFFSSANTSAA